MDEKQLTEYNIEAMYSWLKKMNKEKKKALICLAVGKDEDGTRSFGILTSSNESKELIVYALTKTAEIFIEEMKL